MHTNLIIAQLLRHTSLVSIAGLVGLSSVSTTLHASTTSKAVRPSSFKLSLKLSPNLSNVEVIAAPVVETSSTKTTTKTSSTTTTTTTVTTTTVTTTSSNSSDNSAGNSAGSETNTVSSVAVAAPAEAAPTPAPAAAPAIDAATNTVIATLPAIPATPATAPPITPAPEEAFSPTGGVELGFMHHGLTADYPRWNGQFFKGWMRTTPKHAWQLELLGTNQFDDSGTLLSLGHTYDINQDWYTQANVTTSRGGFFLSRLKVDAALNYKWLEDKNLVTTVSLGAIQAKDDHRDVSAMISAAYHFKMPLVLEGGVRFNQSRPGNVFSSANYVAATYGHDQKSIVSMRYGFGTEAYQLLGGNAELSNFSSDVLSFGWRHWLRPRQGFQLRLESYKNPNFNRYGVEASLFQEF